MGVFQLLGMPVGCIYHGAMTTELRRDAQDNRRRILAAARETYAKVGLDAPMTRIARRAGVGLATLYRRFPTRQHLITEAFADQQKNCDAAYAAALADPDPWRALCRLLEVLAAAQVTDKGFGAVLLNSVGSGQMTDAQDAGRRCLQELQVRAKKAGRLRPDFSLDDVVLLLVGNSAIVAAAGNQAGAASRRFVAHMLQSFGATAGWPLPPTRLIADQPPDLSVGDVAEVHRARS